MPGHSLSTHFNCKLYTYNKQPLIVVLSKDWILTEEEKVMKRRKHRNRDSEKKDADSSSMMCPSPENRSSVAEKSGGGLSAGQSASQNIIILPILPLSLNGKNDANDVLSSLNKQEILSYINDKLNINLGKHARHVPLLSQLFPFFTTSTFSSSLGHPFSSWTLLLFV